MLKHECSGMNYKRERFANTVHFRATVKPDGIGKPSALLYSAGVVIFHLSYLSELQTFAEYLPAEKQIMNGLNT